MCEDFVYKSFMSHAYLFMDENLVMAWQQFHLKLLNHQVLLMKRSRYTDPSISYQVIETQRKPGN